MPSNQEIRDYVATHLANRAKLTEANFRPSDIWADGDLLLRYVRTLPDIELERLRFHTYYITGDSCLAYISRQDLQPKMTGWYEQFVAGLSGFRPSEAPNSFGIQTPRGELVTYDLLRYMLLLGDLHSAGVLSRTEPTNILEIGGGFGGLARLALEFNENVSYMLCDLEETLFFQAVYLTQTLGSERVHLLDGSEDVRSVQQPGHAYLMPQHCSERLYRFAFDITVNQQSLQEMTADQVKHYCDLVEKTSRYFYSCNRSRHHLALLPGSEATNTALIDDLNGYLARRFTVHASNVAPGAPSVPDDQWPAEAFVIDLVLNRTVYKMPVG